MAKIVALAHIQVGFHRYQPGDQLPATDADTLAMWLEAGTAMEVADDYEPPVQPRAMRAAAEPGMAGSAAGGEQSPDPLVGKVPDTPARKRGRSKRKS